MGKRILLPVDGSEQSRRAVEFALEEFPDAGFVLLHVIDPAEAAYGPGATIPSLSEEWYERATERAEELFAELREEVVDGDVAVGTEIEVGRPSRTIVEYAGESDVDMILMGSHGRSGVSRILLGSVAETVVREADVPVTVAR